MQDAGSKVQGSGLNQKYQGLDFKIGGQSLGSRVRVSGLKING